MVVVEGSVNTVVGWVIGSGQMGKRTRRPGDETEEEHGGRPQNDTSSYENMCDIVG